MTGLTFLGPVAIIAPLRPELKAVVTACHDAGTQVTMVTGAHPTIAATIAQELNLIDHADQVVTCPQLKALQTETGSQESRFKGGRVFARMEPQEKVEIMQSVRNQWRITS
ncbi:MAG: HAD family hydrolase [Paracoccaceae bacterium]